MGTVSSNVASDIAYVTGTVTSKVSNDSECVNNNVDSFYSDGCHLDQVTLTTTFSNICNATQTLSNTSQQTLTNDIAQQMAQKAISTTGALGIGFAQATNAANQYVNSSTFISSSVTNSAQSMVNSQSSMSCIDSNWTNVDTTTTFGSDYSANQALTNNSVQNAVTSISQSLTQEATATVQGLAAIIIVIIICITIALFALTGPIDQAAGNKVLMGSLLVGIPGIVIVCLWASQSGPFTTPTICNKNSSFTCGSDSCIDIVNYSAGTPGSTPLTLQTAPLRYSLHLLGADGSGSSPGYAGLLRMAIATVGANTLCITNSITVSGVTIPLVIVDSSSNSCIPNDAAFLTLSPSDLLNARYQLILKYLDFIDLNIYIIEDMVLGNISTGNIPPATFDISKTLLFTPANQSSWNYKTGLASGGSVAGDFGICENSSYKWKSFFNNAGYLIIGVIVLALVLAVALRKTSVGPPSVTAKL